MNKKTDSRICRALAAALCLGGFLALVPLSGAASRGSYSMEILVDGLPLAEYAARGTTYIEALENREYSIRLRNHTGARVAVALSVDGLNSIDAKSTTARGASKWILGPWQTITVDGWQTSRSNARRFFFTTEENSYGAWLGKTRDLGLISAAVFRERRSRPAPIQKGTTRKDSGLGAPSEPKRARAEADAPHADAEGCEDLSDDHAATGIGREVDHRVRRVRFDSESRPSAVIELRYEYHDGLVRLGVLPRPFAQRDDPLSRRERSRGFQEMDFAPDPYR